MSTELQESKRKIKSHEADVTTYLYDKNRRIPIDRGTRAANVLIYFGGGDYYRAGIQTTAVAVAIDEWSKRWGPFPWDLASIHIYHFTCQVLVEVRVEPRG